MACDEGNEKSLEEKSTEEQLKIKDETLVTRDPRKYFDVIEALGQEPEIPELYEEGRLLRMAEAEHHKLMIKEGRHRQLLDIVKEEGISSDDIYAQTERKREILMEVYEWKTLKGCDNIAEAGEAQIGGAFKTTYQSAQKYFSKRKHGDESR